MARPVILGNGGLTVGLNEYGLVHDFYYPYVGLDNLSTSRRINHKIGVWVDGAFSWIDDGSWKSSVNFNSDALISNIEIVSKKLKLKLEFNDFVDHDFNAFIRNLKVHNQSEKIRQIRIFFHQVFQISRDGRADTGLFVPDENYILDYKGRCSLLIYGQHENGQLFDQFAIGIYGIEDKEGTFRDAEDGELTGNAVEHGGVDSVLRFQLDMGPNSESTINYWVVAADSQYSAEKLHFKILEEGVDARMSACKQFWHNWLSVSAKTLQSIDREHLEITKKSLMTIKAHIDQRGGVIASCDSSIYNYGRDYYSYVWPRDGAFVLWPLIRLGYTEEPKKFFEFCRDILNEDGYLMHKYQPDKAIGSTWHPMLHKNRKELAIQEDETAIVIYMLGQYLSYSQDDEFIMSLYSTFIQPAANFMADFIDESTGLPHASYDLWEEKFLTTTYTVALVYQALIVASDFADKFEFPDDALRWSNAANNIFKNRNILFDDARGAFRKGYLLDPNSGNLEFDNTLDVSSLYAVMMFNFSDKGDSENINSTAKLIEGTMLDKSPSGGTPRYENDQYFACTPAYLGNPWFVSTLWMAQFYARYRNTEQALKYLKWAIERALPSGVLSEQVDPTSSKHISVTPLVWSHAELINTVLDVTKLES